jgi:SPOC domain
VNMSVQQFAAASTRQMREQHHQNILKDAQKTEKAKSYEGFDPLVQHNANNVDISISDPDASDFVPEARQSPSSKKRSEADSGSSPQGGEGAGSTSSAREVADAAEQSSLKRMKLHQKGALLDEGTRLVGMKPVRTPEQEAAADAELMEGFQVSKEQQFVPDMTKPKGPSVSVLELLKQKSSGDSGDGATKVSVVSAAAIGNDAAAFLPPPAAIPDNIPVRLICDNGGPHFSVCRPGSSPIECTASLTDRRVQGLLKPTLTVEGRTRIADLERFINETSARGKKIIATCQVFVRATGPDSAYAKFCEEFTTDRRSGISNISESVAFYVVPPLLKDCITVLRSINCSDVEHTLYGVIVTKDEGPDEYVHAIPEFISDDVPASPERAYDDDNMDSDYDRMAIDAPGKGPGGSTLASSTFGPPSGSSISPSSSISGHSTHSSGISAPPPHAYGHGHGLGQPQQMHATHTVASSMAPRPLAAGSIPPPRPQMSLANAMPSRLGGPMGPGPGPGPRPTMPGLGLGMGLGHQSLQMRPPHQQQQQQQQVSLQPAANTPLDMESIRKVAQFCATNGVQAIGVLKAREQAAALTPFLFEGQPGHQEFLAMLKEILGLR